MGNAPSVIGDALEDGGEAVVDAGSTAGNAVADTTRYVGNVLIDEAKGIDDVIGQPTREWGNMVWDDISDENYWERRANQVADFTVDAANEVADTTVTAGDFIKVMWDHHVMKKDQGGGSEADTGASGVIDEAICNGDEMSAFVWDNNLELCLLKDDVRKEAGSYQKMARQCGTQAGEIKFEALIEPETSTTTDDTPDNDPFGTGGYNPFDIPPGEENNDEWDIYRNTAPSPSVLPPPPSSNLDEIKKANNIATNAAVERLVALGMARKDAQDKIDSFIKTSEEDDPEVIRAYAITGK